MSTINFESSNFSAKTTTCRVYPYYSSKTHDYLPNWHNELEIIYTVSGSETIYIDNDCYVTEPGDIVVVNTGRVHTIMGENWVHHCIIPSENLLKALNLNSSAVFLQPFIRDKKLGEAFLRIIEEHQTERKYSTQFRTVAIQQFLLLVFEFYETNHLLKNASPQNPRFAVTVKVIEYLRQHLAEDFSIEEIAKVIGISTPYMCRCVKATTGSSIIDHLNRIRCYTAKHYLTHSDMSVSEIAKLCGYQSNSYFAKTYQKVFGYAPSETPRQLNPKDSSGRISLKA